jgi:hypothetical protein
MSTSIYDAKQFTKIAKLFSDLTEVFKEFEPGFTDGGFSSTDDNPLYIFGVEIVIRHRDDYTIGRIAMDDYLFFEFTDETYGEKKEKS